MTLVEKIFNCFKDSYSFSLQEAYRQNADKPQETVRARIYEKIGVKFERVAKGVYRVFWLKFCRRKMKIIMNICIKSSNMQKKPDFSIILK